MSVSDRIAELCLPDYGIPHCSIAFNTKSTSADDLTFLNFVIVKCKIVNHLLVPHFLDGIH